MNLASKIYYKLTAGVPRLLPRTEAEYEHLKRVLVEAYGVLDREDSWLTVSGQITSTPAHLIRKSWAHIANAAKRLHVNKLAHEYKSADIAAINAKNQAKLEEAFDAYNKHLKEQENAQVSEEKLTQTNDVPLIESLPESSTFGQGCESKSSDETPSIGVGH